MQASPAMLVCWGLRCWCYGGCDVGVLGVWSAAAGEERMFLCALSPGQ